MSIFKNMMSALGFSGEDNETASQPYTAQNITNACVPESQNAESAPMQPSQEKTTLPKEEKLQLPDSLLDELIGMLNRSLPDYAVAAIDKEVEKKYLYQQLGDSFKKFVDEANTQARSQMAQRWKTDQDNLKKELEVALNKVKELEEQRNTIQSAQLSADRQRRATTEKVHDLEARVASLEAEREQFELENKSLVNKLKVANVHQEELDNAREDSTRLMADLNKQRARIAELEQQVAQAPQAGEADEQLVLLRQELEQQTQIVESLNQQLQESQAKYAQLQEQLTQVQEQLVQSHTQLAQSQAAAVTMAEVEAKWKQAEQATVAKAAEVEMLTAKLQQQEEAHREIQTRWEQQLATQKAQWEQAKADNSAASTQAVDTLKNELEQANAMLSALRNQRQELLAQIETLKQQPPKTVVVEKIVEKPVEVIVEKPVEVIVEKTVVKPIVPTEETSGISFAKSEVTKPKSKATPKAKPAVVTPVVEVAQTPVTHHEESITSNFSDFSAFDGNWLIPTRPDTPEQIAKRKEEERRKQEEEARLAAEQKKAQQVDPSQMSLW